MTPHKCPACDGYGTRPRPIHEPGEGPVTCCACKGCGLVYTFAPFVPSPDPLPWWQPPYRVTWTTGAQAPECVHCRPNRCHCGAVTWTQFGGANVTTVGS